MSSSIRAKSAAKSIRFYNEELQLCNGKDIVKYVKSQRLISLGLITRMRYERHQKSIVSYESVPSKVRGRPRLTSFEQVLMDLRKLGVRTVTANRGAWKRIVNETKAQPDL